MNGSTPRILIFDSGMGGLTVARAVRTQLPQAHLIYAADNAAFPYGAWDEDALVRRIVAVLGALIEKTDPHIAVIACNTASTIALAQLRETYNLPFVGTVPAIKPAAAQTRSGIIGVLATPGTVSREYTHALDPRLCLPLQSVPPWRQAPRRNGRTEAQGQRHRSR